jgi:hypothetical protein
MLELTGDKERYYLIREMSHLFEDDFLQDDDGPPSRRPKAVREDGSKADKVD